MSRGAVREGEKERSLGDVYRVLGTQGCEGRKGVLSYIQYWALDFGL